MSTTSINISKKELSELIEKAVEKKLLELFGDPEAEFILDKDLHARLARQKEAVAAGERGEDFESVVRQLGLE